MAVPVGNWVFIASMFLLLSQISNAYDFIKALFPSCVKLETCVASESACTNAVAAVENAISSTVIRCPTPPSECVSTERAGVFLLSDVGPHF